MQTQNILSWEKTTKVGRFLWSCSLKQVMGLFESFTWHRILYVEMKVPGHREAWIFSCYVWCRVGNYRETQQDRRVWSNGNKLGEMQQCLFVQIFLHVLVSLEIRVFFSSRNRGSSSLIQLKNKWIFCYIVKYISPVQQLAWCLIWEHNLKQNKNAYCHCCST